MQIFIQKGGQQLGPYTPVQVNEYLAQGSLQGTDPAWHNGLADWCPLNQIAGVIDASSPTPPAFDPNEFAAKSSEPVKNSTSLCPKCQASVKSDQLFCISCGEDLSAPVLDQQIPTSLPPKSDSLNLPEKLKSKKKKEVVVQSQIIGTTEPRKSIAGEVIKKILSGCFMVVSIFCLVILIWWGKWRYGVYSEHKYMAREISGVYQLIEQGSGNIREIELFRNQTPEGSSFLGDGVYRTAFGDRPVTYYCSRETNFMGDSRYELEIETKVLRDGKKSIQMLFIIDPESMGGLAKIYDYNYESLLGESSYEIQKK